MSNKPVNKTDIRDDKLWATNIRESLEAIELANAIMMDRMRDHEKLKEDYRKLDEAYDTLATRMRLMVRNNHRITKLLRKALEPSDQIGCGLEGMVQSLLARTASLEGYKERIREAESYRDRVISENLDLRAELRTTLDVIAKGRKDG